ncbi:MAG: hypothetical protein HOQ22_11765 [Nocardioidaceae bacterium]|nr:hypothetical protein [Nocardioidaceae bacterium]NUS51700.1 hypothetical protein [Nocardioidaceae bacterium]
MAHPDTQAALVGQRHGAGYFTSFYGDSPTHGIPDAWRPHAWPRITRYDDRWRGWSAAWCRRSRKLDAQTFLLDASLRRIADDAGVYGSMPCLPPLTPG